METNVLNRTLSVIEFLRTYHQHQVVGVDNIPRQGPALVVMNHSLATYDGFLLAGAVYLRHGRIVRTLGDRRIFRVPVLSRLASKLGFVEGSPLAGEKLLKDGHLVLVAPGGMKESLRPSSHRYEILWNNRPGFARLSLSTGAPIVLAACPCADNIYRIYKNVLTPLVYERFRMPLPIARGLGLSILTRPVRLRHYISPPIHPPSIPKEQLNDAVPEFHSYVIGEMQKLMTLALEQNRGQE